MQLRSARVAPWAATCAAVAAPLTSCYADSASVMSPQYNPDPFGMGLVPDLRCAGCERDRYEECVISDEADVLQGPGVCEIKGVPCTCGATLIRNGWLEGSLYDDA